LQIRAYADLYRIISPKTKYRLSTVADDPFIYFWSHRLVNIFLFVLNFSFLQSA